MGQSDLPAKLNENNTIGSDRVAGDREENTFHDQRAMESEPGRPHTPAYAADRDALRTPDQHLTADCGFL